MMLDALEETSDFFKGSWKCPAGSRTRSISIFFIAFSVLILVLMVAVYFNPELSNRDLLLKVFSICLCISVPVSFFLIRLVARLPQHFFIISRDRVIVPTGSVFTWKGENIEIPMVTIDKVVISYRDSEWCLDLDLADTRRILREVKPLFGQIVEHEKMNNVTLQFCGMRKSDAELGERFIRARFSRTHR